MDSPAGTTAASPRLVEAAREMLNAQWRSEGYTMPNAQTYPWQWLWDSCFHALCWTALGDERGLVEIENLFACQTSSGFVPHMTYHPDPPASTAYWGRTGSSTITQPPMYGHALAALARSGLHASPQLLESARRGLGFLFEDRRRSECGLIELCHPWESGCDDSARWDSALAGGWSRDRWRKHKTHLLASVEIDSEGGAVANPQFRVASIGFNALVAFNGLELAELINDDGLRRQALDLSDRISNRWSEHGRTWIDDGDLADRSGSVPTADAHFALLVEQQRHISTTALADLIDDNYFGGACGPAGIRREHPTADLETYWRGPAWPQMTYLFWLAATQLGDSEAANSLAAALVRGAEVSGFGEYWHPDTGAGGGARPQSWAAISIVPGLLPDVARPAHLV